MGWEFLTAGAVTIIDGDHLRASLARGDRLRVKLGLDPTRPDLHLGHTVVLRVLRRFQEAGHTAVLIIGDTTAQIGDPSGQNVTRPQLSREQVDAAARTYLDQVWKILDSETTEVRRQSEWFEAMRLNDLVRLLSCYTVARMLDRDDFAGRMKEGRPVGLHELLYPLLQAYDSVAVQADLELGGTDQTFNLLVGRDIQEAWGQPPQDILTTPLLEGLDGVEKMSKSLDNYVAIDESPNDAYRKIMSLPDPLILRYFRLVTDIPVADLLQEERNLASGENPRHVKKRLATRIVTQFHGAAAAKKAEAVFEALVQKDGTPPDMATFSLEAKPLTMADLFVRAGLATSKSEARRLALQRGLYLNREPVASVEQEVEPQTGWILQRGSHRFVRLIVR